MTTITWEHDVRVKLYWLMDKITDGHVLYLNGIYAGHVIKYHRAHGGGWFSCVMDNSAGLDSGPYATEQAAMDETVDTVLKLLLKSDT